MQYIDCNEHGQSLRSAVSPGIHALAMGQAVANHRTRGRWLYFLEEGKLRTDDVYALDTEIFEVGFPVETFKPQKTIGVTPEFSKWLEKREYICFHCLEKLIEEIRQLQWIHVRISIDPMRRFRLTVDELPEFEIVAESGDKALGMAANELERLEASGANIPNPIFYSWLEYVMYSLCSMGKVRFGDLPAVGRFLRRGYPTMWDKMGETCGYPLAEGAFGEVEIDPEEIVWHYVYDPDFPLAERQARIEWTGNLAFHF